MCLDIYQHLCDGCGDETNIHALWKVGEEEIPRHVQVGVQDRGLDYEQVPSHREHVHRVENSTHEEVKF